MRENKIIIVIFFYIGIDPKIDLYKITLTITTRSSRE